MFGYIKPCKAELKLKEIKRYSGYYCGLCDQLKRDYGAEGRVVLSYDVTFLLVFLDNRCGTNKKTREFKCPYKILRKQKIETNDSVIEYAAFINYWLTTEKLFDDYTDGHNVFKWLLYKYLTSKKRFKIKKEKYHNHVEVLTQKLRDLYALEKKAKLTDSFDELTNMFGDFFVEMFRFNQSKDCSRPEDALHMDKILFNLGKWIYIIDAFDDYAMDLKKKNFNVLSCLGEETAPSLEEIFKKAMSLHYQIRHKINLLINRVSIEDECIKNILTHGIDDVFDDISQKKYESCLRSLSNDRSEIMESMGDRN